jgi:hypothetical protein
VKTFFAIALNCVYLTLTVGVAHTTHYCMGRLNSSSYFSFQTDPCSCSVLAGKLSSCCDNESVLLQVDDEQTQTVSVEINVAQLPRLEVIDYSLATQSLQEKTTSFFPEQYLRPPPPKAYLLNCSLMFYDELA